MPYGNLKLQVKLGLGVPVMFTWPLSGDLLKHPGIEPRSTQSCIAGYFSTAIAVAPTIYGVALSLPTAGWMLVSVPFHWIAAGKQTNPSDPPML